MLVLTLGLNGEKPSGSFSNVLLFENRREGGLSLTVGACPKAAESKGKCEARAPLSGH